MWEPIGLSRAPGLQSECLSIWLKVRAEQMYTLVCGSDASPHFMMFFTPAPRSRSWCGCRRRGEPAPSSGSRRLPAAALRHRRGRAGRAGCGNRRLPRALAKCDLEAVIKGSSLHSSLKVWPSREERSCSVRGMNSWKESSGTAGVRAEISSIAA